MLAPLLLGLAVALGTSSACEDDSVYRSGALPPSAADSGSTDDGGAAGGATGGAGGAGSGGAPGDTDGGAD